MPPKNKPQIPASSIVIDEDSVKSNAFADQKKTDIPRKQVQLVRRKKARGLVLNDDVKNVVDFIWFDVLVPAAKSMISDAITGGLDLALFGEKRDNRKTERDRGRTVVSYSNYYKDRDRHEERPSRRRGRHLDDMIFKKRVEADDVLNSMLDLLDEYHQVSVDDLYDLIGVSSDDFTDKEIGWTNLSRASVERVRGGYLLDLPRPSALE